MQLGASFWIWGVDFWLISYHVLTLYGLHVLIQCFLFQRRGVQLMAAEIYQKQNMGDVYQHHWHRGAPKNATNCTADKMGPG